MSTKPRTIDQLGVDASTRYAKDKELLDPRLIEEARFIPQKTEVSVLQPYRRTEFEEYLDPQKASWTAFLPPPDYLASGNLAFSHQLLPSLGSPEKMESDLDKLEGLSVDKDPKKEKERQIILNFLRQIKDLNQILTLINARRNQYQKG